jgi:hypothetical protein
MCTIPYRKRVFTQVVKRIISEQTIPVDKLHVWLNGYKKIDKDLPDNDNIEYHLEPDNPGPQARYRIGDSVNDNEIILTLDDDLNYPYNYVEMGIQSLQRLPGNLSICFGGVFWDWVVPIKSLEYHAHKRLISYKERLDHDTIIPVLMSGVSFHKGKIFKKLLSNELKGFTTNDDLMASYNIQKGGAKIVSVKKPSNWITEFPEQLSENALWRRDVKTRINIFKLLINNYGFIPWCEDIQYLKKQILEKLISNYPKQNILHILKIIEGNISKISSKPVSLHYEHIICIPTPKGRFEKIPFVQKSRLIRVRIFGWKNIRRYMEWIGNSLNLKSILIVYDNQLCWIEKKIIFWIKSKQCRNLWELDIVDLEKVK